MTLKNFVLLPILGLLALSACASVQTPSLEGRVLDRATQKPLVNAHINLAYLGEDADGAPALIVNHWTVSDGEGNFTLESQEEFYWTWDIQKTIDDIIKYLETPESEEPPPPASPTPAPRAEGGDLKELRLLIYAPAYQSREVVFPLPQNHLEIPSDAPETIKVKVNLISLARADEKTFTRELQKLRQLLENSPQRRLYLPDPDFLNQAEYEFIRRFPQSREAQLCYLTIAKRTYHKQKDPQAAVKIYREYLQQYPEGFLVQEVKEEIARLQAELSAPPAEKE